MLIRVHKKLYLLSKVLLGYYLFIFSVLDLNFPVGLPGPGTITETERPNLVKQNLAGMVGLFCLCLVGVLK